MQPQPDITKTVSTEEDSGLNRKIYSGKKNVFELPTGTGKFNNVVYYYRDNL